MLEFLRVSNIKSTLYAWLIIGTNDRPKRQAQRIVLTNVMITVTALLSYLHAIMFALYDIDQLIGPFALLLIIGTALLATPFLNKKHPYLGSVFNLSLWLGYGCSLTYIFGTESAVYFYFLAGAASAILIVGIYHNLLSVLSITLQIGLFTYFDRAQIPPAEFLHLAPAFYNSLHFASILLSMVFIFCMIYYAFYQAQLAEDALQREYEYSEKLLSNMMPAPIAAKLKRNQGETIAESHDDVTILFADIVDFTPRAENQNATELVQFLNNLFTRFDLLVEKYGLEKIKTIGDAFMVAGGMPNPQTNHAMRVAYMALDMMNETHKYAMETGEAVELRIGLHTGPAVAGVIGTRKPLYDVWGDTVNTASRLESSGTNGKIQVTDSTKALLDKIFMFKKRGKVKIKGKGELDTWYLTKIR
ncbi:MAG: adenylate/guanylate cyclase domain-containing protein [Amylibacter sp.]